MNKTPMPHTNESHEQTGKTNQMIACYLACKITADDLYDRGRLMGITEPQMDILIHEFHIREAWLDHSHLHL